MKTTFLLPSLLALPALFVPKGTLTGAKPNAECLTAEEEAAELQKILQAEGGMVTDPEDMRALLMKSRGQKNRKPPHFMRLTGGLKMMSMIMPNDGFKFSFGIPFTQRFQTQLSWSFSNSKPAEFDLVCMLAGGGNMMMQDEMSMIQTVSSSAGRTQIVAQKPLGHRLNLSLEADVGADENMSMQVVTLTKDFNTSHIQYQYQGVHQLSYMQSITENLIAGYSMTYVPQNNRSIFAYAGRYNLNAQNTLLASYNPAHPQEKLLVGLISRPSKRLALFAEVKQDPSSKTDFLCGYRAQFMEGQVTGTLTRSGKAGALYKRMIDMFEVTFTGQLDFSKPNSPSKFGVSMSLGGGM